MTVSKFLFIKKLKKGINMKAILSGRFIKLS